MTDTATTGQEATTENGQATRKTKDVNRKVSFIEGDLPPAPTGGGRASVFKELLDEVASQKEMHGRWACISDYGQPSGAASALVGLRDKYGKDQNISGWVFASRKIEGGNRTGLFVSYDPSKIDPEATKAFEKAKAEKAKAKKDAETKAAAKGGEKAAK